MQFAGDQTSSDGKMYHMPAFVHDCRVVSFKQLLPADGNRKRHLIQIWTDPGGMRTLSVGSIRLKDPGRVAAGLAAAATREAENEQE